MNWSDKNNAILPDEALPTQTEETQCVLYPGDVGELRLETRRVLVQLLLGPALDGRRQSKLWPILVRDEVIIRSRLAELFLDLIIDRDQQVAFTRQADVGDLDRPVLLRRSPLTFIDSVLLLFLRQQLTFADTRGERAVVDVREIGEHLNLFERSASTDHAGFGKKVKSSIEKMKKNSILQTIGGSEERYEISPTLKLLFSAEQIQALTSQYDALTVGSGSILAADPETNEESEE